MCLPLDPERDQRNQTNMEWEEESFPTGLELTLRPCVNLLPLGFQFSQLGKEEGDGCHLMAICALCPGVPFLALVSRLPLPISIPGSAWVMTPHCPTGRWTSSLDSSLRKLYRRSPAPPDLPAHPWPVGRPIPCSPYSLPARGCGRLALGSEALAPEWV